MHHDPGPAMTAALTKMAAYQAQESKVKERLKTFDTLYFEVFTRQKWDHLHESHARDIVVHWSDEHWNEKSVMDEEYLFWDNLSFMKQIGLSDL